MGDFNERLSDMEQPYKKIENEENLEVFINALVVIVEKYGKAVLDDLDCVA